MLGRDLGGSVALDAAGVRVLAASIGARGGARAGTAAGAETDTDKPKLCPDPMPEIIAGRSDPAVAHQSQITGLPPALAVEFNGVKYDGCRESDGHLLEAKGQGFAKHMSGPDEWEPYFRGRDKQEKQIEDQSRAAGDRIVEWHVAEKPFADYLHDYAKRHNLDNVIVIYTPADQP